MKMEFIDIYKIECTVLSTFLFTPELLGFNTEAFKMESKYFTNDFNKMICVRVMKELDDNGSMSLLEIKLSAWVRDVKKQYQAPMMELLTASPIPLSVAKKYYEEMKIQYFERLTNGR
tara:strand:+ start:1500 stop:1853 length:354 start_codon:yes stop_codon:yes gene_type:complete